MKTPLQTIQQSAREEILKHMVSRFLCWKLPDDFSPDGGISFDKKIKNDPVGTNLLTATQAEEMVKYMLDIELFPLSSTIKLLESQIDFWQGEMMSNPAEAGQFALHSDGYNQALEECIEADRELIKELTK